MSRNNAGKDMWLRAQTANQKWKQKIQTEDSNGIQVLSVVYMTQIEPICQQQYISWE